METAMSSDKQITLSRAELYERVWKAPLRSLAKELGVSDVGLAKICERHEIPRPEQGHWVRVRLGQNPERTPLGEVGDAKLDVVRIAVRPKVAETLMQDIEPEVQVLLVPVAIVVELDRPISHPLVVRTKKSLAHARKDDRGLLFPKEGKPVPHIRVSQGALPRALSILDALFRALGDRKIAITWDMTDDAKLHVTVLGESVSFWISERIQRVTHTLTAQEEAKRKASPYSYFQQWDYKQTGELSLVTSDVPYGSKIRQTWADGAIQRLENCLGDFLAGLHLTALAIKKHRAEREKWQREWDEQQRRRELEQRREEEFERKAKIITEASDAWHTSKRIAEFAVALGRMNENAELSERERRDLGRLARWTKGYARRLNPILRFENLVGEFKGTAEE
jgi:hypothetical protein